MHAIATRQQSAKRVPLTELALSKHQQTAKQQIKNVSTGEKTCQTVSLCFNRLLTAQGTEPQLYMAPKRMQVDSSPLNHHASVRVRVLHDGCTDNRNASKRKRSPQKSFHSRHLGRLHAASSMP